MGYRLRLLGGNESSGSAARESTKMSSRRLFRTASILPPPLLRGTHLCGHVRLERILDRVTEKQRPRGCRGSANLDGLYALEVTQHLFGAGLFESGSVDVEALDNAVFDQHGKTLTAHAHSAVAQI